MAHKLICGQSSLSFTLLGFVFVLHCTLIHGNGIVYRFTQSHHDQVLMHNVSEDADSWRYFCFEGLTKQIIRLWSDPVIKIQFINGTEPKEYKTIAGVSEEDLDEKSSYLNPFAVFKALLFGHAGEIPFAAFNKSCVGILTDESYTTRFLIKSVNLWFVARLSLGVLIFLSAKNWSHNTALHYSTGVSIGVMASIIILLIVLHRVFPQSLRKIGYLLIVLASSTSLFLWTSFVRSFYDPITNSLVEYWQYILGYVIVTGLVSFGICYKYGPVTDPRSLNLIQWLIQAVGLVLVYNGTQIQELSIALIIILLTLYNTPRGLYRNRCVQYIRYRLFPTKHRFLTEEEYVQEGIEVTAKALDDLRSFCRSPDCDSWKVISRLKSPHRFAQFVEGNSWHVNDDELLEYDSGPEPALPTNRMDFDDDDDDEDDDEIDFQLDSS